MHQVQGHSTFGTPVSAPGQNDIVYLHRSMGTTACQGTPMVPPALPKVRQEQLTGQGKGPAKGAAVFSVVDISAYPQGMSVQGAPLSDHHDRRQCLQLGGPLPVTDSPGPVEPGGPDPQDQLSTGWFIWPSEASRTS